MTTTQDSAQRFSALHEAGCFVLPNAWDPASAAVIAAAGAQAIATTSSGVSWTYGVKDGDNMTREQAVAAVRRIVDAVEVPVSADVEAGYGDTPAQVSETIAAVLGAGAVGVNLEDRGWPDRWSLRPVEEQCERLAAARAAAPRPFVINARCDVYLARLGESEDQRIEMVLERGEHSRDAGADCLFVPGVDDVSSMARFVEGAGLPVNALLAAGRGPTIGELRDAGVRRISAGHAVAAAAYTAARDAAVGLLGGHDSALRGVLTMAEIQELLHD